MPSEDTQFKPGWEGGPGRPPGSSQQRRWNNLQDVFAITIEQWEKLTPIQKVEKGLEWARMILEKVPIVHLTAEQSVDNVIPGVSQPKQCDSPPQPAPANGGGQNQSLGNGTSGLPHAGNSEGTQK